jgi:hypothetical protein
VWTVFDVSIRVRAETGVGLDLCQHCCGSAVSKRTETLCGSATSRYGKTPHECRSGFRFQVKTELQMIGKYGRLSLRCSIIRT